MTQVDIIRRQLKAGKVLTQRTALMDFGIMALPRRIADLKQQGFPVRKLMKTNPLTGQRYAEYSMSPTVEHLYELKVNHVYRLVEIKSHPFHKPLLDKAHGYFTCLTSGTCMATIRMAGQEQVMSDYWLKNNRLKIEHVGAHLA